ncbi:isochorismatase family protein [Burkholderia cenocepacia]|uniref:isochorismatase family protein n=1 Tax=Burkholderia cenocepacia TaxID=95486 RepID=UPI00196B545B|nr:isochorismatase family protein [Burkholderia cenocepacia]MBN3534290.1 isochorismatase family protein [Burkholderia cenocepacia]MBR8030281.1 isochorismatase family protein [Burkholderia cenocepacia]MBR8174095.1 isochorismatase family protein [Burkholderia cenocepacia]MBR8428788.1 isochorismatase family protein [Burkholderia cenocepacia]MBU9660051.1 isochorismatase family protein [Burkholderia cenocepacia]
MSAKEKFRADEVAILLIDHQVGTMGWVHSIPFEEMKGNTLLLAQTAKVLKIPTVLTSSMEDHAQGPLLAELETILPAEFAARVKRAGIVDAMDDENFANAVKATGRRKFIVAGVTNDVCTVHPVVTLLRLGHEVQVVADAGGSPTVLSDQMALNRMQQAGAILTSAMQVMTELVGTWATPEGQFLAGQTPMARDARSQSK